MPKLTLPSGDVAVGGRRRLVGLPGSLPIAIFLSAAESGNVPILVSARESRAQNCRCRHRTSHGFLRARERPERGGAAAGFALV